jgi:phage-related minor tail protein
MEEPLEVDPQQAALEEVIRILTPLRQHRQASAERQQRLAERELTLSRERLAQSRIDVTDESARQVEQRQALKDKHLNQATTLTSIDRWHDRERSMLDQLSRLRQGVVLQNEAVNTQQQVVLDAQRDAKAAQRAVEKLACLAEAIHDES